MRPKDTTQPTVAESVNGAPVAQLDRALAFEATGRGFESLRARQYGAHCRSPHDSFTSDGQRRVPDAWDLWSCLPDGRLSWPKSDRSAVAIADHSSPASSGMP